MVREAINDPWAFPRFQLWSISNDPPRHPTIEYGISNDNRFTIRVVHGGNFTDFPGKPFAQTTVDYITYVNINLLNMELLGKFSKCLGYDSFGYWSYMPVGEHSGLTMIPILDEDALGDFKQVVRAHHFREVETLYVEHKPKNEPVNFPHHMMISPSKRIEKLLHLLLIEDPYASVDCGIAYIKRMMNMTIPRGKIADGMDRARENVLGWRSV